MNERTLQALLIGLKNEWKNSHIFLMFDTKDFNPSLKEGLLIEA